MMLVPLQLGCCEMSVQDRPERRVLARRICQGHRPCVIGLRCCQPTTSLPLCTFSFFSQPGFEEADGAWAICFAPVFF